MELPVLLDIVNETLRPAGDLLAGVMRLPGEILGSWKAKGLSALPGFPDFTQALLDGEDPPSLEQLQAIVAAAVEIDGSGSGGGGRVAITTADCVFFLRALRALKAMIDADPAFALLVYKFAVNPDPKRFRT